MEALKGEVLLAGSGGEGEALVLGAPISFWGGVDPKTGRIADPRHPNHGACVAGRILFVPGTIGSSSAAAVLLELVHGSNAPLALVLDEPDAILILGLIVAQEMGLDTPVALRLGKSEFAGLAGRRLSVSADGVIATVEARSDT